MFPGKTDSLTAPYGLVLFMLMLCHVCTFELFILSLLFVAIRVERTRAVAIWSRVMFEGVLETGGKRKARSYQKVLGERMTSKTQ